MNFANLTNPMVDVKPIILEAMENNHIQFQSDNVLPFRDESGLKSQLKNMKPAKLTMLARDAI